MAKLDKSSQKSSQKPRFDEAAICLTIDRLLAEGLIDAPRAAALHADLPRSIPESQYVLYNLGVHGAIGVTFAYDFIPLPLGTLSRITWVAGNRIFWTLRRNKKRLAVHSFLVLGVSAIPWVGYLAYTIPLRRVSDDLCYVYANHVTYHRNDISLEAYMAARPRPIARLMRWLLMPKPSQPQSAETQSTENAPTTPPE